MTIVLACLTCVLALTGAAFARDLAGDAVLRARAQAAADAAALAAVASSVPGQRGQPVVLARSFDRRFLVEGPRGVAAAAGSVWLVSGVRSSAEQSRLWADAVARYGSEEAADDWVAPPGRSMHERGVAVDLGGDVERAARLVEELGLPLYRPLANEPWHFELQGARS